MTTTTQSPVRSELTELRLRVRLLKGMVTHINSGLDVKQLVERTLLEAHKNLPEFRISYCTLDEHGQLKVFSSVAPMNMPGIEGKQIALGPGLAVARNLRLGVPLCIGDVELDERMASFRQFAREVHTRSMLLMPIMHPQQVLAYLLFASPQPREWTSFEIETLTDMTEYLAIAIRDAHLRNEQVEVDAKLRESQKMEAVGRLVGGVAHDFNNLLTGMMIYSGLLSSALGPASPLQRHVREIQGAGERGASLVGQLLSLSRRQVLETRVVSINDVVGGMREMLQRVVGEDVLIECHLAGDLSQTRLDENQLRQAILNLAINARDAMKAGGRLILATGNVTADEALAARVPGLAPGDYCQLRVADTGSGMSAETLAHCFEPFYTTKPTGEGTGLGLAAVYGMVRQHGGAVAVSSTLGAGTTFEVYFPVADGPEPGNQIREEAGRAPQTVLLVEDEALLRVPLTEKLQAEGYRVLTSPTPEAALEASVRHPGVIELLVTDLVMPGMTGEQLADKLRGSRPEMRVLFMSGYTDDPRARRLIAQGADFLRKPFDAGTFARRVREVIERAGMRLAVLSSKQEQKSISSLGKET